MNGRGIIDALVVYIDGHHVKNSVIKLKNEPEILLENKLNCLIFCLYLKEFSVDYMGSYC